MTRRHLTALRKVIRAPQPGQAPLEAGAALPELEAEEALPELEAEALSELDAEALPELVLLDGAVAEIGDEPEAEERDQEKEKPEQPTGMLKLIRS